MEEEEEEGTKPEVGPPKPEVGATKPEVGATNPEVEPEVEGGAVSPAPWNGGEAQLSEHCNNSSSSNRVVRRWTRTKSH